MIAEGTQVRRHAGTQGFTLNELLVVIAIIVLVAAFAVPAFNFISGSRSEEAAENLISAMLAQARTRAMNTGRRTGVAFYVDPASQRTVMTLVQESQQAGAANGFTSAALQTTGSPPWPSLGGGTAVNYQPGQEIVALVAPPVSGDMPVVARFRCTAPTNKPPTSINGGSGWAPIRPEVVDLVPDAPIQPLPVGLGYQLVNDPFQPSPALNPDRYVRTGAIMFDAQGSMVSIPIRIDPTGEWGVAAGVAQWTPPLNQPPEVFRSQIGIVMYDGSAFKAQGFTDSDVVVKTGAALGQADPPANVEFGEEAWLDQNSIPLTISRNGGAVVKGQ